MEQSVAADPGAGRPAESGSWIAAAWPYALILVVGLFVLAPKLGQFGFWDPWEPKYTESAREMVEKGSYIVPYYRDEVRLTKPILTYWGILVGALFFGLNELGARVVGVGLAIASMLGVFYAVSKLRGRQAGLLAALVLGTLPHFFFISRQAMPDVYLFTSLGSSLIFLCLGLFGPDRRRALHFGISYACFALAVLAKGPIIVSVVYFVPLLIYAFALVDLTRLREGDLRSATWRLLATGLPASLLSAGLAAGYLLLGTPAVWWGYSKVGRMQVNDLRRRVMGQLTGFHVGDVLLVLLAVGTAGAAVLLFRRGSKRWSITAAAGGLAAVVCLVVFEPVNRVLAASVLGAVVFAAVLIGSVAAFLRQPGVRPMLSPYLKPLGRQALLFVGVFLVVAGPWHAGIVVKEGHGYFTDFILKHNVHRAGEKVNQTGVSDFYLRVLIFGFFPWCCFIPLALTSASSWWERSPFKRHGFEAFLLISAIVTLVAFSSSVTKFPHYLSPLILPMAVLVALTIDRMLKLENPVTARLAWLVAAMFYIPVMLDVTREESGIKYLVGSFTVKRYVPDELEPGVYFSVILFAAAAILLVSVLFRSRILIGGLVLSAVLMAHYNTATLIPNLSRHKTMKNLCDTWRTNAKNGEPIGFYGDLKHGIYIYTDYAVQRLRGTKKFLEFMDPEHPAFSIVQRKHLPSLDRAHRNTYDGDGLNLIDSSHFDYALVTNIPEEQLAETRGEGGP